MKVDNKTLKFSIFILAFLSIVMVFVFVFVIPSIKEFKHKRAEYYRQMKVQKEFSSKEKFLQKELQRLQNKYAKSLALYKVPFEEKKFLGVAKKYFQNVKLTQKSVKKSESGLQIYEFTADFSAQTPVKFYQFIEAVNSMKNVVKINFPITLEARNNSIFLKFNMSVYKL